MNSNRGRGFDPEQFFGPEGPFGPRGPLGPGGIFGPQGPFGTGGAWPGLGGFGQGGWQGEGRRGPGPGQRGGGRRARRGDVRSAILQMLQREPMNGYQLMQGIADATGGEWAPSSGAIYPALAQLEDEGLVEQVEIDGRKAYQLTDAGRDASHNGPSLLWGGERKHEQRDEQQHRGRRSGGTLWKALGSVAMATQAVGQTGDDTLTKGAAELLDRTRRELYRMLAEAEVARDEAYAEDDEEFADGELMDD